MRGPLPYRTENAGAVMADALAPVRGPLRLRDLKNVAAGQAAAASLRPVVLEVHGREIALVVRTAKDVRDNMVHRGPALNRAPADPVHAAVVSEDAGHAGATAAAEALGVNPSTHLGHENGSRGIRPVTAEQYARGLGCDASWILYGDGELSVQARAMSASPVPGEVVVVPDRRLAEVLAVLADTFEDYNPSARRDLIARFWIAFPELKERADSGVGRRLARLARG